MLALVAIVSLSGLFKKPPPSAAPPPPSFQPSAMLFSLLLCLLFSLLFFIVRPRPVTLIAVCELGQNGKASGDAARKPAMPVRSLSKAALPNATVPGFVPQKSDKVSGSVKLVQKSQHGFSFCRIDYSVSGLNSQIGFRIRDVGDVGTIVADALGVAKGSIRSDRIKLSGKNAVVGNSMIVTRADAGVRIAHGEVKLLTDAAHTSK